MEPKIDKLLQQAGKFVVLGKLTLALEQYLKIHQLEPEDPTIINTIGDLYVRLDDKESALVWYQNLAEKFEMRELYSNAIATYRKILKLSPKNQDTIVQLAQLYERRSQPDQARTQYHLLAKLKIEQNHFEEAIDILKRICASDPGCIESRTHLARCLERIGKTGEALESYLESARLVVQQGNLQAAAEMAENIFRLEPRDKEFLKAFFVVLQRTNLTERGLEYLRSFSLHEDPEFRESLVEMFIDEKKLDAAQQLVLGSIQKYPNLYKPAISVLKGQIHRRDVDASITLIEDLFETSVQLEDEGTIKSLCDSLAKLSETNIELLKRLSKLLMQTNDHQRIEGYLTRLTIAQLLAQEVGNAHETLEQLAALNKKSRLYRELLDLIDDAALALTSDTLRNVAQTVIEALERGSVKQPENSVPGFGQALGVSQLDLGVRVTFEEQLMPEPV